MNIINRASLLFFVFGTESFQMLPSFTNRTPFDSRITSRLFSNPQYKNQPSSRPPYQYTDEQVNEINIPSVGNEFRELPENEANDVIKQITQVEGPFFIALLNNVDPNFSINKINKVIVGEEEDYQECSKGNCYNFATNTLHNGDYKSYFPGSELPRLNSKSHKDNCQELKDNIFEEFGENVRITNANEECNEDEIGFKSYVSQEISQKDFRDYHFVRMVEDSTNWHKRGGLPAMQINNDEFENGNLKSSNTLWIKTINSDKYDDELDELGEIKGVGKIHKVYGESSLKYDECDSFCLKISQKSGNSDEISR